VSPFLRIATIELADAQCFVSCEESVPAGLDVAELDLALGAVDLLDVDLDRVAGPKGSSPAPPGEGGPERASHFRQKASENDSFRSLRALGFSLAGGQRLPRREMLERR